MPSHGIKATKKTLPGNRPEAVLLSEASRAASLSAAWNGAPRAWARPPPSITDSGWRAAGCLLTRVGCIPSHSRTSSIITTAVMLLTGRQSGQCFVGTALPPFQILGWGTLTAGHGPLSLWPLLRGTPASPCVFHGGAGIQGGSPPRRRTRSSCPAICTRPPFPIAASGQEDRCSGESASPGGDGVGWAAAMGPHAAGGAGSDHVPQPSTCASVQLLFLAVHRQLPPCGDRSMIRPVSLSSPAPPLCPHVHRASSMVGSWRHQSRPIPPQPVPHL